MQKWSICKLAAILILLILNNACGRKVVLLKTTVLPNYPSASSIDFYKGRLYIMGDDATKILVADTDHNVVDSIPVFTSTNYRIDKSVKADMESSVLFSKEGKDFLVAFSSFSTPGRNKLVSVDLSNKKLTLSNTSLEHIALKEINIEGAAIVNNKLLLSNRANTTHKNNSFIVLDAVDLNNGIEKKGAQIINILLPPSDGVIGISGLAYIKQNDLLLFSASTEDTPDAYLDGAIGTSYIGMIKNISALLSSVEIKVDKLIPLLKLIAKKTPQKIESLTAEEIKGNKIILHLAADNDNGESTLFKMRVTIP